MAITELRVEVEKDELTVLDAYVNATGKRRDGDTGICVMTIERAIVVLSLHNAWRRGSDVVLMVDPKELGEAIAFAIDYMSRGVE